ncbi:caspase family protein, partial [Stenotrophomonas maltophilia]|uniref:caspase family protein n=1 Tax=Stenotrophomonas maltophilia TaxID=40324 RepID=UPI003D1895B5
MAIDAGKTILETAIVRLGERLEKAGPDAVGFFYFAGHGIQHQGANYLVPIDAHIPDTR